MPFIRDNSIDLVATDPPYFDNLNYSRLADFFYVWLRIGLMKDYEFFRQETSAREREAVMDGVTSRTADRLVESLTNIFKECHRVLKPNRPMVFTFHHTKDWAWQGLMKAIRSGGFSVVESHFIRSEGRTGFRKSGNISYDVCIVCRKAEEVEIQEKPRLAISRSSKWIRRLVSSGNGLQNSDVHSIVMGNLLTYAPNLVLNGFTNDKWVESVLKKCRRLKNDLETEHRDLSGHLPAKKEEHIFEDMKKQTEEEHDTCN
jgi:adenine-specific DNA methylase